QGLMLNYANNSDVRGNLVRGGAEKCTFIYNAHRNLIVGNRFEGCGIGIHFTAGSERNALTGNAFVGNQTQVKYVGTRDVEWSFERRGNFWSDHPAFDLNGDAIADSPFRPNDLMDHILWSQPAAALLMGAPAVQLIRWSQASFPATLPGGVLDSFPQVSPVEIAVPEAIAAMEAASRPAWRDGKTDDAEPDPLASH
ncbi:MAG TPA: NosD domain-containing protein, partial [Paracoccaceae bacterium]